MEKGWYVVHTYSGYEQKIERIINKLRETDADFALYCTGVTVPMETVNVLTEKGEKKTQLKKLLPDGIGNDFFKKITGINPYGFVGGVFKSSDEHSQSLALFKRFSPTQCYIGKLASCKCAIDICQSFICTGVIVPCLRIMATIAPVRASADKEYISEALSVSR